MTWKSRIGLQIHNDLHLVSRPNSKLPENSSPLAPFFLLTVASPVLSDLLTYALSRKIWTRDILARSSNLKRYRDLIYPAPVFLYVISADLNSSVKGPTLRYSCTTTINLR